MPLVPDDQILRAAPPRRLLDQPVTPSTSSLNLCLSLLNARAAELPLVTDAAAAGDGVNDDAPAFVAALVAHQTVMASPATYATSSFTVPAGKILFFFPGATLAPLVGETVTVNGQLVHCGGAIAGAGTVAVGTGSIVDLSSTSPGGTPLSDAPNDTNYYMRHTGGWSTLASTVGTVVQAWSGLLDALAALGATGLVAHTGSGTVTERSLTSNAAAITWTNPAGIAGNPAINLDPSQITLGALGGTLAVAKGGTGATTANLARVAVNQGLVTLTDATSIATDCSLGNAFQVTIGGNRTLANPTNVVAGATYIWRVKQDGTGGRTLSLAGNFKLQSGVTYTASTAANAVDIITAFALDASTLYTSVAKGW